ncbi:hypothetical protein A2U01_0092557 [Trifolium medium]|uniref:Uncharacterized protein n=1 Tax=Trifolium medium TaxID=97028 RepID=A0A392UF35_9FABA|nr:hypothetical protein [Trifolium medium]
MSRATDPEWRALISSVRKNKASPSPAAAVQPVQASPSPPLWALLLQPKEIAQRIPMMWSLL